MPRHFFDLYKDEIDSFLSSFCQTINHTLRTSFCQILIEDDGKLVPLQPSKKEQKNLTLSETEARKLLKKALEKGVTSATKLSLEGLQLNSFILAPIRGPKVGLILVGSKDKRKFTPQNRAFLKEMATFLERYLEIGSGFFVPTFYEEVVNLSQRIFSSSDTESVINAILEMLSSYYPQAFIEIRLLEGNTLRVRSFSGPEFWNTSIFDLQFKEGTARLALSQRTSLLIPDVRKDSRYTRNPNVFDPTVTYLGLPLYFQDQVLGVISIAWSEQKAISAEELFYMETLSRLLSDFLFHFQVLEQAKGEEKAIEDTLLGSVLALASAVEAKDSYTSRHLEDVAALAVRVGQRMNLSQGELKDLQFAAILHDIGKVGIPDHILRKPAKLTPQEWQIVRSHPAIGEMILSKIPRLENVSKLVRWHQERWDGKGYPDGLKEEEIPLAARILSAVDAYSAMIDKRPYRDAMNKDAALAELKRCSGTQFDPAVIEALLGEIAE